MKKFTSILLKKAMSLLIVLICAFSAITNAQVTINGAGSYATINAAVTAASPGDIIEAAPGVYNENVLLNKNNLILRSSGGKAVTTIQGITTPGAGAVMVASGTNGVTIGQSNKGFTIIGFDGNGPIESAALYLLGAHTNITIEDNEIRADGDHGLLSNSNAAIDGILIKGNMFTGKTFLGANPGGCGFGTQFDPGNNVPRQLVTMGGGAGVTLSKNVYFLNNTITGTAGGFNAEPACLTSGQGNTLVTIDVIGCTISGNTFAGITTRFGTSLRTRGPASSIFCNTFQNGGLGAGCDHIFFGGPAPLVGASPSTLAGIATANSFPSGGGYVAPGTGATFIIYRDLGRATAVATFLGGGNIAVATALAANCPVLNVNTGMTFQTIQSAIDNPLTLNGHTIQAAAGTYNENVIVNKSLTIRGPNNLISPNGGGRVAESTITGGLSVDNSASRTIVIEGFHFQGVTSPMVYNGNLAGTIAADLTFRKNLVNNSSGQLAVDLGTATNSAMVVLDDNSFVSMSGNAIQLNGGTGTLNATVINNSITGTITAGINTNGISTSTFDGNTISNTGQQGIQVAGMASNVTISNNVITNANTSNAADRGGIRIRGALFSGFVNVTNNIISGSNNGIALPAPDDITGKSINVNNNNLSGNTKSINHFGSGNLNATCNWYGSTDNATVASKIAGNVTYIPYLLNGTDNSAAVGFQPVPGSCNGPQPTISFTATTTSGSSGSTSGGNPATVSIDFCEGAFFTFSGYSSTPVSQVGSLEDLVSSGNVLYNGNAIPPIRPQSDIAPANMASFFSGTYGPYSLSSGTSGTIDQTYTPYYDVNNDGNYDAVTDILGSPIVLHYNIYSLSTAPSGATGTTTICNGSSTTLTVDGGSKGTGAITEWFTGSCGGTSAGTGDAITVSPATTTTYYVRYNGTCNTTNCATVTITVNPFPTCSITAVPANNTYTGGVPTNIYLGYGPQSLTLNASGGSSYFWSGPVGLNNYNIASPVFTASTTGSFTYTVEVTNSFGCKKTCSITICVTDIRVPGTSGNNQKVYLCHVPTGNPGNAKTLSVSVNAVAAHLGNHAGDRLGKCEQLPCSSSFGRQEVAEEVIKPEVDALTVKVMPNPATDYFLVSIESKDKAPVSIIVINSLGQFIETDQSITPGSIIQIGENYKGGIYYLQVKQGNSKKLIKLMKLN